MIFHQSNMPSVKKHVIISRIVNEEKCSFKLWNGAEKSPTPRDFLISEILNMKKVYILEMEEGIVIEEKEKISFLYKTNAIV